VKTAIHDIFITLWILGKTPEPWKQSHTVLLYKAKDTTEPSNYRPIGLANTVYKLWTSTVTKALAGYAEQHHILSSTQEGFRVKKSTHRQIMNLIQAIEDSALTKKNLYVMYVDFSSAFNTIDHDKLLQIMYDLGFPCDAIDTVKHIYTDTTTQISTHKGLSNHIHVDRGTLQGDNLSPFLFLCFIEPLLRWQHSGGRGYRYGCLEPHENDQHHLSSPAYADDLAIATNNTQDMQIQKTKLENFNQWAGLTANASKCSITGILHGDHHRNPTQAPDDVGKLRYQLENQFLIQGKSIPFLSPKEPYKYLGIQITMTLNWEHQTSACIRTIQTKAEAIRHSMASDWQKLRLLETILRPAITYSMATTSYSSQAINKMDAHIARAARTCLGLPSSTATVALLLPKEQSGMGIKSLWCDYVNRSIQNLTNCLNDTGRLGTVTRAILQLQNKQTGDLVLHLGPKQARFLTALRQLALCAQADLTLQDPKGHIRLVHNTLFQMAQEMRNNTSPHQGQNPFMQTKLRADLLAPLAQLGITSLAHITKDAHILSTNDLTDLFPKGQVTNQHKQALNQITLLITGQHEDEEDPTKYNRTTPLTASQRRLPQEWDTSNPTRKHAPTVTDLWLLPQHVRPQGSREDDQVTGTTEAPPPPAKQRKVSKATLLHQRRLVGRRTTMACYADDASPEHYARLAMGDHKAIISEYQKQDRVTKIMSHHTRGGQNTMYRVHRATYTPHANRKPTTTERYFTVQWGDTVMPTATANRDLAVFRKMGYLPQSVCDGMDGNTTVTWAPQVEPANRMETEIPNWSELMEEYETNLTLTQPSLGDGRKDGHLNPMQQQGGWTETTEDMGPTHQNLRDHIHLDGTPSNPDADVTAPHEYTMQRGEWMEGGPDPAPGQYATTYFYDPLGRFLGKLPTEKVTPLLLNFARHTGHTFAKAAAAIATLFKQIPAPPSKKPNVKHLRMPNQFMGALQILGIQHEHNTTPLLAHPEMTYSSIDLTHIPMGASNGTFTRAWKGASLLQGMDPTTIDTCIRWALASAQQIETPFLTMLVIPETHTDITRKFTEHPQFYSAGAMAMRILTQPTHWSCTDGREPELTYHSAAKRPLFGLYLIANPTGLENHASSSLWEAFTNTVGMSDGGSVDTDLLNYPTSQGSPETPFKFPKKFLALSQEPDTTGASTHQHDTSNISWPNRDRMCRRLRKNGAWEIYTDGSCQKGITGQPNRLGAAFVTVRYDSVGISLPVQTTLVRPMGKGPTNTINRAELSAIHMALRHISECEEVQDICIYTDSLCALQLIKKGLYNPQHLQYSKHRALVLNIATLLQERAMNDKTTSIKKVKSHIGIQGNELADQGATRMASGKLLATDVVVDEITDPVPFQDVVWVTAKHTDPVSGSHTQWPLSNLTSALQEHTSPKWQAGEAPEGLYRQLNKEMLPYVSQKHSQAHWGRSPFHASLKNFKLCWGLVWNARKAHLSNPAISPNCPLCHHIDGASHIYGGCMHSDMKAHYIARHNAATLLLFNVIRKSVQHSRTFAIVDATAEGALPPTVHSNRIPEWILPHLPEEERLKMRPDILLIEGLDNSPAAITRISNLSPATRRMVQRNCKVHVIEVGYASNTRYLEKLAEKSNQHEKLVQALKTAGWKVQYTDKHRVILGTGGYIFKNTVSLLEEVLMIPTPQVDKALNKLSTLAVDKGCNIITCRRQMERVAFPTGKYCTYG
jgi:ribonuclease HI